MTFTEAVRTCFRKYVTFSGRASRSEYWWFVLFLVLGSFVAGIIDGLFFGTGEVNREMTDSSFSVNASSEGGPVAALFGLVTLLPSLAAGWRRMHDTGRSGFYLFLPLLVMLCIGLAAMLLGLFQHGEMSALLVLAIVFFFLSPLLVLWWLTRPSEPGSNQYGPNPHEVTP